MNAKLSDIVQFRDIRFNFKKGEIKKYWSSGDPWMTHFYNGLMFAVPDGERWVMESARKQALKLTDADLKKTVRAFIRQEAAHSREHDVVNEMMLDYGLPSDKVEGIFRRVRERVQSMCNDDMQASIAAAIEHFTAIFSEIVLQLPEIHNDMDPKTRALVYWHMVEETEHKAVSFDLFHATVGHGFREYLMRTGGLVATFGFGFGAVFFNQFYLLWKDKQLTNARSARFFLNHMTILMPKLLRSSLPYIKPSFHPWDNDNREVIRVWREVFDRTQDPVAATEALREWQFNKQNHVSAMPPRAVA